MCKFGGLLYAFDNVKKCCFITDADCNAWSCPECRARLKDRWVLRALHGSKLLADGGAVLYFATITSHENLKTFGACAAVFPDAWAKLHKRLNRTTDKREYFLVPEKHKDGRMHVHAIWTFPVNTRWLKDNGRECGFGYKNQIGGRGHVDEPITDLPRIGQYVGKYLTKSLGDGVPARFRRVRTSKGWAFAPEPENEASKLDWHYVGGNGMLNELYKECTRENLDLIDIRTGEIFDDVDLGTIVYA